MSHEAKHQDAPPGQGTLHTSDVEAASVHAEGSATATPGIYPFTMLQSCQLPPAPLIRPLVNWSNNASIKYFVLFLLKILYLSMLVFFLLNSWSTKDPISMGSCCNFTFFNLSADHLMPVSHNSAIFSPVWAKVTQLCVSDLSLGPLVCRQLNAWGSQGRQQKGFGHVLAHLIC